MAEQNNIRVAHILKDLDLGGIQTLLLDVLTYYRDQSIPCLFVCIGTGVMRAQFEQVHPDIRFIEKKLPYFDPRVVTKLRKLLKEENINIVHAHHTSEGIASWLATKGTGIRYVQSFHVAPTISNAQDNMVLKLLARKADLCISPSQSQLDALQDAGYNTANMQVVHNGVYPGRLLPKSEKNIRKELGIESNHLLLASIGNFYNDTRDQLTICSALPAFFQKHPEARFVFYGGYANRYQDKPERYQACISFCEENGIADKTFFPGQEGDIGSILSAADLFVYSSLGDTFGMAITEAMLQGTPLIVNDLPVLAEVTGGQEHAYTFPTKDHETLAATMIHAVENAEETTTRKEKAKAFATSRYTIEKHVRQLHALYASILTK